MRSLVLAWGCISVSDKHQTKSASSGHASQASDASQTSAVSQTNSAPSMDWYIIKVAFNREDSIRDSLMKRIKLAGLDDLFGEIIIPTEDVVTFTRTGTRRVVKRKLYPGYLMAHMSITDDSWFLVRETPGVGDFTGAGGKPTPMDPADVVRIIKLDQPDDEDGDKPMKTSIPYRAGDRVRVKEGNFQNLEGEVEKVDEANGRVTVIISIFGRSTPVELDHWQVEQM